MGLKLLFLPKTCKNRPALPPDPPSVIRLSTLAYRGGVEDKRLEVKAKATKKSKAKDSPSKDRHSQGEGQECSRPRTEDTNASVLKKKKKKKKVFRKNFRAISRKNRFPKNFSGAPQSFNNSKIVLSLSRGQGNF